MERVGRAPGTRPRILRRARDAYDFLFPSIDRYVLRRGWAAFGCEDVCGISFWGTIDVASVIELAPLLNLAALPNKSPRPLYVDVRLVDGFAADVFALRSDLLSAKRESLKMVTRGAIVYATGIVGAIALGLRDIAPPPFPEEFFTDPVAAMRSLGCTRGETLVDELDEIRRGASAVIPILDELRAMIDVKRRLTLPEAARSLGHSPRSLQRKLAQAGTSFQEELSLGTVKLAQRMLLAPGANVTEVSLEVGCASSQHLSRLFRKVVGETPTGWRDRHLRLRAG